MSLNYNKNILSAIKKLAGETLIYGVPSIVGRFLNLWLTPLYTYLFLPAEYGILSNILAYVSFLQVILTYGMETSYFRFAARSENSDRVFASTMFSLAVTSIIFTFFVCGFAPNISNWLGYKGHQNYIVWMGLTVVLDTLCAIPFAKLRLQSRPVKFAVLKSINISLSILLNVFWIFLCPKILQAYPNSLIHFVYNPEIGIGYAFISFLVSSAVTMVLLIPEIKIVKSDFDFILIKKMLNYGWPILVIGIAGMAILNIDKILLPKLLVNSVDPIRELGIYSASSKLAILMTLFIQAFRFSFEPFLFSQLKNEDSKKVYALIMKYFIIIGLFIFLGVMFYIDILKYFIGSSKYGYHEGIKVVPWLLIGNLFMGIFYTQSLWYKITDKTHFGAQFSIIGAIVTIGLNYFLVPVFGYMACGYAFFAGSFVMTIVSYYKGQKHFPVKYDMKRFANYFFVAIVLYLIEINLGLNDIMGKIVCNTFLLIAFITFIYLNEKTDLKRLFNFKKR